MISCSKRFSLRISTIWSACFSCLRSNDSEGRSINGRGNYKAPRWTPSWSRMMKDLGGHSWSIDLLYSMEDWLVLEELRVAAIYWESLSHAGAVCSWFLENLTSDEREGFWLSSRPLNSGAHLVILSICCFGSGVPVLFLSVFGFHWGCLYSLIIW